MYFGVCWLQIMQTYLVVLRWKCYPLGSCRVRAVKVPVGRFYAVLYVLIGLVQDLFVPAERPGDGTKFDLPSIELCDNAGVY